MWTKMPPPAAAQRQPEGAHTIDDRRASTAQRERLAALANASPVLSRQRAAAAIAGGAPAAQSQPGARTVSDPVGVQRDAVPPPVTGAPIQRKIGFEMEYAIPISRSGGGSDDVIPAKAKGTSAEKANISEYFSASPGYDNAQAIVSGPGFKAVSDKEYALGSANIELWKFLSDAGAVVGKRNVSETGAGILEYVTEPVDELSPYSTNHIQAILAGVGTHMAKALAAARKGKLEPLPENAGNLSTGFPRHDLRSYCRANKTRRLNLATLDEKIRAVDDAIRDRVTPQATVGIIPSGLYDLHRQLADSDMMAAHPGSSVEEQQWTPHIANAANTGLAYAERVIGKLDNVTGYSRLTGRTQAELHGIVTLIAHYIVGEAYLRSGAFEPYKAQKNAVPLMSKIDLATLVHAAPGLNAQLDARMIGEITQLIETDALFNPDEVRAALAVPARVVKDEQDNGRNVGPGLLKDEPTQGFAGKVLAGAPIDHRGKRFQQPDTMNAAIAGDTGGQAGVPLEFRRLSARPGHAGLWTAFEPVVTMARDINLKHSGASKPTVLKNANKGWAQMSYGEAAHYHAWVGVPEMATYYWRQVKARPLIASGGAVAGTLLLGLGAKLLAY